MANEEQLEILRNGVDAWNMWRAKNPEIVVDLQEANLRENDLREVDLGGANLSGADFRDADLCGANLSSANLSSTDLRRTNLRGANLSGAILRGVDLAKAYLSGVDFREQLMAIRRSVGLPDEALPNKPDFRDAIMSYADLEGANLRQADLKEVNLREADLKGADLREADLKGADLKGANLTETYLSGADLTGVKLHNAFLGRVNLSGINLGGAHLTEAYLVQADLRGANLRNTELSGAVLKEANLGTADLGGANLRNADLSGADIRKANLRNADLRGAYLLESDLSGTDLRGANFGGVIMSETILIHVVLNETIGLESIGHVSASFIGTDTIFSSHGKIPDAFLRGCGLSDWEIEAAKLSDPDLSNQEIDEILYKMHDLRARRPLQISPLFISYSHIDSGFVDKLEKLLNEKGIRFWRDIHHATSGKLEKQIDIAIRQNPTVVLVLSKNSQKSDWVEHEVRTARELEKAGERDVLCPIALDNSWKSSPWPKRIMEQVMEYNILDFSEWQDDGKFEAMFRKLIGGLELFYKG